MGTTSIASLGAFSGLNRTESPGAMSRRHPQGAFPGVFDRSYASSRAAAICSDLGR